MSQNTSDLVRLMSIIMQLGRDGGRAQAFVLEGPPGVGKTMSIDAVARAIEARTGEPFPAEVWSGPQIQAEDAAGLPVPDLESGTTRLLPLRLGDQVLPVGRGVLGIDEFGSISPSQEAAFLNLLQGGRLGERTLPGTIALCAMMNPDDHASNARSLSAPAANRFVWLSWRLDTNTWLDYMKGGPGFGVSVEILKEGWEKEYGPKARSLIASYIKRNPSSLLAMPQAHDASKAWPSPRSWETAARVMAACMSVGERKESDLVHTAIEGCVGEGHAEAFMHWLVDMNLPDPEELLKDPKNASKLFPERNDQLTITMEALASAACQDKKDKTERWKKAWEILGPVFTKQNDVGLNAAVELAKNHPAGTELPPEASNVVKILEKAGMYKG